MDLWQGMRMGPGRLLYIPLNIICRHFVCCGQTVGQQGFVHTLVLLDGMVFMAGFSALLIGSMGINGISERPGDECADHENLWPEGDEVYRPPGRR